MGSSGYERRSTDLILRVLPGIALRSHHARSEPILVTREIISDFTDMEGNMDTKAKIKEVLVNLLKVKADELKDELSLQDSISVDSTEMVESVIALEKAFNIKLSPKEITKYSSINDIEKVILSK